MGNYDWRLGLYDDVGDLLDESTRSGAIDHEDMTPEIAEVLSTKDVHVRYEVSTGVEVE